MPLAARFWQRRLRLLGWLTPQDPGSPTGGHKSSPERVFAHQTHQSRRKVGTCGRLVAVEGDSESNGLDPNCTPSNKGSAEAGRCDIGSFVPKSAQLLPGRLRHTEIRRAS